MAVALMAAGLVATVAGGIQQGNLARQQAEAQASISEYNAQQKEYEGAQHIEGAKLEEQRVARMARLFRGEQIANIGSSGTEFSGSNIEALGDIAYQTRLDRDLTLREGLMAGQRATAEADASKFEARWSRLYGRQAQSSAYLSTAASGLSGAAGLWGAMPMGRNR